MSHKHIAPPAPILDAARALIALTRDAVHQMNAPDATGDNRDHERFVEAEAIAVAIDSILLAGIVDADKSPSSLSLFAAMAAIARRTSTLSWEARAMLAAMLNRVLVDEWGRLPPPQKGPTT